MRIRPITDETSSETPQDITVAGGCPTCDGETEVRIGPWGVRAYCARCARVSRAVVLPGERGMQLVHPAAAA